MLAKCWPNGNFLIFPLEKFDLLFWNISKLKIGVISWELSPDLYKYLQNTRFITIFHFVSKHEAVCGHQQMFRQQSRFFLVSAAAAVIHGEASVFVKPGSTISLTCSIRLFSSPPTNIQWFRPAAHISLRISLLISGSGADWIGEWRISSRRSDLVK